MKVSELIEELKKVDPDNEVIMSKDGEGNSYSPLSDLGSGIYIAENTWSGECYNPQWSCDDAGMGVEEWEEILKKPRCTTLWPTN